MSIIPFSQDPSAKTGTILQVEPLIRRVVAPNPGPYTYTGTCTYIVGHGEVAIIDPGPNDSNHLAALLSATANERITHIAITHTHLDHTAGLTALQEATAAQVVGCAPHFTSRPRNSMENAEAAADLNYAPDMILENGDQITGKGWTLEAVSTPGHTANHLSFALKETKALFSGDHVMAWSTSLVAPPDGSMADYMCALEKLRHRDDRIYWPGHGGPVQSPRRFVRAMLHHRRQREAAIFARIEAGDTHIQAIVQRLYNDISPSLKGAAALSVYAHIENLLDSGKVRTDDIPHLNAHFRVA